MKTNEYFVVVTEHDCAQNDFPFNNHPSSGSIVHETMLAKASLIDAVKKCAYFHLYGKVAIARLEFLTDEEIRRLLAEDAEEKEQALANPVEEEEKEEDPLYAY
jgi:hypothetical protein